MENKEKGFTLIELLIVIAIIGICLSIILSIFGPKKQGHQPVLIFKTACNGFDYKTGEVTKVQVYTSESDDAIKTDCDQAETDGFPRQVIFQKYCRYMISHGLSLSYEDFSNCKK